MKKKAQANSAFARVRVHNPAPAFTLGMPGERRRNMAQRKANRKRKPGRRRSSKRRNTSSVRTNTALVPYRAASPARRSNPKRRRHHKRRRSNPARAVARRSNPFGGKFFGLSVMDLLGGAIGLAGDEVITVIASQFGITGAIALVIRGGGAVAMARWLPRSIGPAAGLVAGAKVVKSALDQYAGLGRLQAQIVAFIPGGGGGNGGAGTTDNGMQAY